MHTSIANRTLNGVADSSSLLCCPCSPTGPYTAFSKKCYSNGFGPCQKVCYKRGLKIVFKGSTPFKHNFEAIFIPLL